MRFDIHSEADLATVEAHARVKGFAPPDPDAERRASFMADEPPPTSDAPDEPPRNRISQEAPGAGQRIIKTFADIPLMASVSTTPIQWILDGLLAEGTVNMLTGEPGAGKSSFLSAMGYAVATGQPFAGRKTSARPVLYLDRENPLAVVQERFARLGITDSAAFHVWGLWCPEHPPDISSEWVIEWIRSCEVKPWIIADSYAAFNPGDENDNTATRKFLHVCRLLASMGATITLTHHTGKSEKSKAYRGGSDIPANLDSGYCMSTFGDPARLDRLRLKPFKLRFGMPGELQFRYVAGQFIADGEAFGQPCRTNEEPLAELLQANPGVKATEFEHLARKESLKRNRARDFLKKGIASGRVRTETGANNATHHYWVSTREDAPDVQ